MKVLVVGSGGREHALAWKIAQSDKLTKLYALPGNAGIAQLAECVDGDVMDVVGVADFAEKECVDLTVVGPESPLIAGMADEFQRRGLRVFGPGKEAAQMEGSKVFAKQLMLDAGVPTAAYEVFDDPARASAYIESASARTDSPIVVKADGEAAGKGVFVSNTKADALAAVDMIMNKKAFGASGDRVVIEEFLDGPEATLMGFCDGETFVPMTPAQDYKRAYDNDEGPNTGGMGAYSPAPVVTPELHKEIMERVMRPTVDAMAAEGCPYKGVLYAGMMIGENGIKVLEFNARFGDPECQPLLVKLETDLMDIFEAIADDTLESMDIKWTDAVSLCLVLASGGYPGSYEKGIAIDGLAEAGAHEDVVVFHAGTKIDNGKTVTNGGRVLGVTSIGSDVNDARDKAYAAAEEIRWPGKYNRTDIGLKALRHL